MGIILRTASATVGILMACAAGQAQMRGARTTRSAPVATRSAVPRVVVHSPASVRSIAVTRVPMTTRSRNGQITIINNVNSTPLPLVTPQFFDVDDFPVPGLGFDFAHLAAINAGRHHRRFRGTTFGSFGGFPFVEFPFFSDSSGIAPVQAAPPQVIIVQQPVPQQAEDDEADVAPRRSRRFYSAPAPEAPTDVAPGHGADEYVLVRRDGGLLFAVAFSVQDGQLNYVTREGLRRTVALTAIDAEATEQMNEQRGMTVRLPAQA
jgi:hypothetical protein